MKTPKLVPQTYDPKFFQFLRDDVGQLEPKIWLDIQALPIDPRSPFVVAKAGLEGAIFISSKDPITDYQVVPTRREGEFAITIVAEKKTTVTFLLVGKVK